MLRELVIICTAAIVSNSPLHIAAENSPAESSLATSVAVKSSKTIKIDPSIAVQPQDNDALASEVSYQSVVPQSVKYLLSPLESYEANAAVVKPLPGNVPVAPNSVSVQSNRQSYENQPITAVYSAIVASDPVAPENNNILETNLSNTVAIKPYYSVPVAAKTLTINQAASAAYSNNFNPAVRQYYGVPLAAKTVDSLNPSDNYVTYSQNVNPAVAFTNNAAPKYYVVPVATNKVSIESRGAVNVHPRTPYAVQNVQPNIAFTAHPPALVKYSVNHAVKPQYIAAPQAAYAANPLVRTVPISSIPVSSKKIIVEAYNSVTVDPPPTPTAEPAMLRYADAPISAKPVPVPVIYQASAEETNYPTRQFAANTAGTYIQMPNKARPLPLNLGNGIVMYNTIPIPRVHSDSFIEKVYTPVGTAPTSADSGNSYAKAVIFSPASEVSRVTFNGFGTRYGW